MRTRVTKKHKEKMRKILSKKKKKTIVDYFCVAYMKIIKDPEGELYKNCTYSDKPINSCRKCKCSKRMKRADN
jgi:hypothetical protein